MRKTARERVTLRNWLGRTVYIVKTADGRAMYDADTGDSCPV
ncbi:MAG: hypothetical protein R3C42_09545 [Parvularculaceae bacterium]